MEKTAQSAFGISTLLYFFISSSGKPGIFFTEKKSQKWYETVQFFSIMFKIQQTDKSLKLKKHATCDLCFDFHFALAKNDVIIEICGKRMYIND